MTHLKILATALALAAAPAAQAATLYTLTGPTAETPSPGSIAATFDAGAGAGLATFQIAGYRSLDGVAAGSLADTFTLFVNAVAVYSAQFELGGAGGPSATVLLAPAGATQSAVSNGFFAGGTAQVSVPISLLAGSNTLGFTYGGIDQGMGDEAWGLANVLVTGNAVVAGVPEPATWGLMIGGFGLVGAAARRRRSGVVTA